jgi:hypothetical protein
MLDIFKLLAVGMKVVVVRVVTTMKVESMAQITTSF